MPESLPHGVAQIRHEITSSPLSSPSSSSGSSSGSSTEEENLLNYAQPMTYHYVPDFGSALKMVRYQEDVAVRKIQRLFRRRVQRNKNSFKLPLDDPHAFHSKDSKADPNNHPFKMTLVIPGREMGGVIGAKGRVIRTIETNTNTAIEADKSKGEERWIRVSARAEKDMNAAKDKILELVSFAKCGNVVLKQGGKALGHLPIDPTLLFAPPLPPAIPTEAPPLAKQSAPEEPALQLKDVQKMIFSQLICFRRRFLL